MGDIAHLSGRTHLVHVTGHSLIDLDAECLRRAQHVREARLARRRARASAAPRGASAPDEIRYPALGRDGPEAA